MDDMFVSMDVDLNRRQDLVGIKFQVERAFSSVTGFRDLDLPRRRTISQDRNRSPTR